MNANLPEKSCQTCGRTFSWRKAWERDWEHVRYCSKACRRKKPDATDTALEEAIVRLLGTRPRTASICPSEAARAVDLDRLRDLIERSRRAGRRLAARDIVQFTQNGRVVDPSRFQGAVRIRRAR